MENKHRTDIIMVRVDKGTKNSLSTYAERNKVSLSTAAYSAIQDLISSSEKTVTVSIPNEVYSYLCRLSESKKVSIQDMVKRILVNKYKKRVKK